MRCYVGLVDHALTGAARAVVRLVPSVGPTIHPRLACIVVVVAVVVVVVSSVATIPATAVFVPAAISVVVVAIVVVVVVVVAVVAVVVASMGKRQKGSMCLTLNDLKRLEEEYVFAE